MGFVKHAQGGTDVTEADMWERSVLRVRAPGRAGNTRFPLLFIQCLLDLEEYWKRTQAKGER